jgi:hypothetical protein
MPLRRLAVGLSRSPLSTAVCLVAPLCLINAGRWVAWLNLECPEPPLPPRPPLRVAAGTDVALAATVSTLIPTPGSATTIDPEREAQAVLMREALDWVDRAVARHGDLDGYTALFTKRERLAPGRELCTQVMEMKIATRPLSIYFRYRQPNAGREAIWVEGRHDGKVLVHEGGLGRLLAGTLRVDPRSRMAMSENRHPITEAGIGFVVAQLAERWPIEMTPDLARVEIDRAVVHDGRPAVTIECTHPEYDPAYLYHKVRVTFDAEHALPVRFQAYGWPESGEPELLEDYAYTELHLDAAIDARDFDPSNPAYQFARF